VRTARTASCPRSRSSPRWAPTTRSWSRPASCWRGRDCTKDGNTTVVDGPFAETKELIAGFWILEVSSREEVIEWVRKAPFKDDEIEIRQVFSADDFGDAMTPELREQEDRLRATVEAQHGA
jgi:hypothetical protein